VLKAPVRLVLRVLDHRVGVMLWQKEGGRVSLEMDGGCAADVILLPSVLILACRSGTFDLPYSYLTRGHSHKWNKYLLQKLAKFTNPRITNTTANCH